MRIIIITGSCRDDAGGSFLDSSSWGQDESFNSHKHHLGPSYLRAIGYSQLHNKYEPLLE